MTLQAGPCGPWLEAIGMGVDGVASFSTCLHDRGNRSGRAVHDAARWLAGLGAFASLSLLIACGSPSSGESTDILVAESASAAPAGELHAGVVAGEVYIVVEGRPAASEVAFHLNDEEVERAPERIDAEEPFDLLLDTGSLDDGPHTVTAIVTRRNGRTETVTVKSATFVVDNDGDHAPPTQAPRGAHSLRADPGFSEAALPETARRWYRRVWAAIEHPHARYDLFELAQSGNLRDYGYAFNQQMTMLLTALRATQDPAFVDLIAELSDVMADELVTKWYDPRRDKWVRPDDGTAGYRRFLYELGDNSWNGRDTQVLATVLSHGMIANMAYALHANRGVESPSGIDYGKKADFWIDYLRNDFEAIWRIRTGEKWPALPLWEHQVAHSWKSQMRWSFYMHKLTGLDPYREAAEDYAAAVLRNTYAVETPAGEAAVWSHLLDEADYGLQPIAYARYEYGIETDLALEGGLPGIDGDYMAMHARALAHFVMDNGSEDLAFDVGGMSSRAGKALLGGGSHTLRTRNPWDDSGLTWGRESTARYTLSYFAPLAAFGATEKIRSVSESIYLDQEPHADNPRNLAIPVGMLLLSMR